MIVHGGLPIAMNKKPRFSIRRKSLKPVNKTDIGFLLVQLILFKMPLLKVCYSSIFLFQKTGQSYINGHQLSINFRSFQPRFVSVSLAYHFGYNVEIFYFSYRIHAENYRAETRAFKAFRNNDWPFKNICHLLVPHVCTRKSTCFLNFTWIDD